MFVLPLILVMICMQLSASVIDLKGCLSQRISYFAFYSFYYNIIQPHYNHYITLSCQYILNHSLRWLIASEN